MNINVSEVFSMQTDPYIETDDESEPQTLRYHGVHCLLSQNVT